MDSDVGVSVYAEAKGEYTKQLSLFCIPEFHRFFMTLLAQAQTDETNAKRHLWRFQELLSQIPDWNVDKVQRETSKLLTAINCDYFEELITAVFIAHTKVLTAIRIGSKKSRVQIVVPKVDHFLHRALSECSRLLWSSAYLFHSELSPIDKQRNHRQIESLLQEGIGQAIRGLLPVKNILKDCVSEQDDAEPDEKDEKEDKEDAEEEETNKQETTIPSIEEFQEGAKEIPVVPVAPVVPVEPETPLPVFQQPIPVPEPIPVAPVPAPAPAPTPTPVPTPSILPATVPATPTETPTLVVETSPSVKFTSYDQVIHINGADTNIQYMEKDRDKEPETTELEFADEEDSGSISDVEDLTTYEESPLTNDDFETLP